MNASPSAKPQALFDVRGILWSVGVMALAVLAHRVVSSVGSPWAWTAFGVVLLGGQSVVTGVRSGAFRATPWSSGTYALAVTLVGGLLFASLGRG